MPTTSQHPETIVLHAGYRSDPATTAVAVPIYQTTSYQFRDTDHAAKLFGLAEMGNIYTRIMNPTTAVLEERIAALEGGVAALGLGSGQAASLFTVQNICQAGDNFVSSTDLYGGTWNLFRHTMKTMGIEVRFVDPSDPENFRRATDARTRCYYAETLPNPKLEVFPIAEVAKIGRELGVPLIVDNTAAPILCQPLKHGAAVVMHSTTKFIGGHGTSIGGIVVDGGNFDWEKHADRFPMLNQPDPSYHGAIWTQAVKPMGPVAYIIKMRVTLLRDLGAAMAPFNAFMFIGAAMAPFNAFMFIQGLETLALRMRQHCANANAVAKYLGSHAKVTRVIHPSVMKGEAKRRADAYLKGGYGGLLGFELKGGSDAGRRFIDALKMFYHVANIGDARSLAIHPASTTHSQLTPEEQLQTGVTDGYVRLSLGIEHEDDIVADLKQALEAV
ncbi:MAG: PLP-dependent transferase [Pseudomonadota bacterium]